MEFDGAGAFLARYAHGDRVDQPLAMQRGGQSYYIQADHQGSVIRVTDAAGAVVNSYEYDAYGQRLAATEGVEIAYGYTGREYDAESGLMYYRARTYDPATGRFLQTDPLRFEAGDLNVYRYVGNNPLNATDPTGEFGIPGAAIGAGLDLMLQLASNGWNLNCVSWTQVGFAGAAGALGGGILGGAFKHSLSGLKWAKASQKFKNVSARYHKAQTKAGNAPNGPWDAHHWAIKNNGAIGKKVPDWIKNHPANLKPVPQAVHQRIHNTHPTLPGFNGAQRWWHGTPEWAKALETSLLGGVGADLAQGCGECQN